MRFHARVVPDLTWANVDDFAWQIYRLKTHLFTRLLNPGENVIVRKSGRHKNFLGLEVNLVFGHPYDYRIFRNADFSRVCGPHHPPSLSLGCDLQHRSTRSSPSRWALLQLDSLPSQGLELALTSNLYLCCSLCNNGEYIFEYARQLRTMLKCVRQSECGLWKEPQLGNAAL